MRIVNLLHLKTILGTIAAWVQQGEIEAQAIECAPYNAKAFHNALADIRTLTEEPVNFFQKELVRLCANVGVAVVFVQELPRTGMCWRDAVANADKSIGAA